MMGLEENIAYARRLHAEDPKAFAELLTQVKAFEPTMLNFMQLATNVPPPLDATPIREELEMLSIELDNASSKLREIMADDKGGMVLALILEHLKASSRHLQDAGDDLLQLMAGGSP